MNKLKLVAGVTLVFLVGALAGSLGTWAYIRHRMGGFTADAPPFPAKKAFLMKRLSHELDLTQAQQLEIEKIVNESEAKILAIRRKFLPEIKKTMDQSFAQMKDRLNDQQQKKLEVLRKKLKDRHARAFIHSIFIEKRSEKVLSRMKERLKLTEAQEAQVRPIIEESIREQHRIIKKYKGLDHPDISLWKQEMHELEESIEKRLEEILTKEQMERYQKIWKELVETGLEMGSSKFGELD